MREKVGDSCLEREREREREGGGGDKKNLNVGIKLVIERIHTDFS
jgi:hypothetical protein